MFYFTKRTMDILIAGLLSVLLLPVAIVVAVAVFFKLGRPVIYSQDRPGKQGVVFKLFKFRSMRDIRDKDGQLLDDGHRLTPFGQFIRSSSLDELPTLWNVLKGEMSLVGPRPLLVEYLPLYNSEQRRRHDVRPGITGWAQVNGRNSSSWDERFNNDLWYVDNKSVALDIKILILTVIKVLKREGINAENAATMKKFEGNSP